MTDNAEVIRSLYQAFERGDVNAVLGLLDPAVEWISYNDPKIVPWGGKRSGVTGAASFFQALADSLDFEVFEPRQFLASGGHVTALGRTRARFRQAGGGTFDTEWAHVFTIENGKVTRLQEFNDTAAIERAIKA